MTLVYNNAIKKGPSTHAFVIGVGAYPLAKPGNSRPTTPQPLKNVKDLPSAAAGAAMFSDWIISEAKFPAPLATVELLKNGPDAAHGQYSWSNRLQAPPGAADPRKNSSVQTPTTNAVTKAGERWVKRLKAGQGNIGLFYICGHGALQASESIVFLADLNGNPSVPWGAFLNVSDVAAALKQVAEVTAVHMFVDACGEIIQALSYERPGVGAKFTRSEPFTRGIEKVSLLAAAAQNYLSYEDNPNTGGRFTLTLLRALRGAAARNPNGQAEWVAHAHSIHEDLKSLYRLQPLWRKEQFEPAPPLLPSEAAPIVVYPNPPEILVRVQLRPEVAIHAADLLILDTGKTREPALYVRPKDHSAEWLVPMRASIWLHWIVAEFQANSTYRNKEVYFVPMRSLLNQLLDVS